MADDARPLEGIRRLARIAPFLAAGLLGWVLVAAPHPQPLEVAPLVGAAALTVLIVAVAVLVSWRVLPDWWHLLSALAWLAAVYLLREGAGGVGSGYSALFLLGVLWPALYGSRRQLVISLAGYAAAQVVWIWAHRSGDQVTFAVLGTTVTGIVCFTVQNLVRRVRAHNRTLKAVNAVSHALAMEEDLTVARRALCAAAADVCCAAVAVLYEPGPQGLLTATAVSHPDGPTPPERWPDPPAPAEAALRTREQQLVTAADPGPEGDPPLGLASSLWQPVLHAGDPVGVLAVGWPRTRRPLDSHVGAALALLADQSATVIERTRLLTRRAQQLHELQELDRLKTDFVSSASHELRTPITSILGYLDVLVEGEAGPLSQEQRSFLEVADRNARRLQALVEDLLVVSRIESGRLELSVRDIDLAGLAERVREGLSPQLAQSGVRLRLDVPPHTVLRADERRIEQVLVNLLSNAIKFSPEGGEVTVRVEGADAVRITVTDHGIGMSERDRERLFQKFFRAESATERAIPGTGLGLAICKGIVDAHGGTIAVHSALGEGTTITVELPHPGGKQEDDHGSGIRSAAPHGARG